MKYQPHDYQAYVTRFILEHPVAAVFLQMGLGKSGDVPHRPYHRNGPNRRTHAA